MQTSTAVMAGALRADITGVSGNATTIIEATEMIVKAVREQARGKAETAEEATTTNRVTEIDHQREGGQADPGRRQPEGEDAPGHGHHHEKTEDVGMKTAGRTRHQSQARRPFWQSRNSQRRKHSLSKNRRRKTHKIGK